MVKVLLPGHFAPKWRCGRKVEEMRKGHNRNTYWILFFLNGMAKAFFSFLVRSQLTNVRQKKKQKRFFILFFITEAQGVVQTTVPNVAWIIVFIFVTLIRKFFRQTPLIYRSFDSTSALLLSIKYEIVQKAMIVVLLASMLLLACSQTSNSI